VAKEFDCRYDDLRDVAGGGDEAGFFEARERRFEAPWGCLKFLGEVVDAAAFAVVKRNRVRQPHDDLLGSS